MKTGNFSFKNIKDVLSRDEMKKIMAGSGWNQCSGCKEASLYACQYQAGYTPGTVGFHNCVKDGYNGCNATVC
jgi:hypothetical protein